VDGLVHNRIVLRTMPVTFREGLRLEQITAKLQTLLPESKVDPEAFYRLVTKPTDALLGDYPWLLDESVRPKGATLEGFLYPATYTLRLDAEDPTTADDLVRMMPERSTTGWARIGSRSPSRASSPSTRCSRWPRSSSARRSWTTNGR
jgi:cell division protein YceG involved in septum cleavage